MKNPLSWTTLTTVLEAFIAFPPKKDPCLALGRRPTAAPGSKNGSVPVARRRPGLPARAPRPAGCWGAGRPARSAAAASTGRCAAPSAIRGCRESACRRDPRGRPPIRGRRATTATRRTWFSVSSALTSFGLFGGAAALLQIGDPFRHRSRLARCELPVALIVLHGLRGVLQIEIVQNPDIEMRVGVARVEIERLRVMAARLVESSLAPRYHAELVVVGGAIGIETERLPQRFQRLRGLPRARVENAQIRTLAGELRLAADQREQRALRV